MKITALSLVPPAGANANPQVTPELLASVLARYSRSNDGLEKILSKVDLKNPEASIAAIFKFVDYGHASIGGLTGGIPVALDGVSLWMAFKLFEVSPYADGQESSTRYITMDESGLIPAAELGFSDEEAVKIDAFGRTALKTYHEEYRRLDALAESNPDIVRYPEKASPAMRIRIRKNYALDRVRYFLPLTLRTNIALIQTARAWTDTISALASLPQPEAQAVAAKLIYVIQPYAPNLIRHARRKAGWVAYNNEEIEAARNSVVLGGSQLEKPATCYATTNHGGSLKDDLAHRENRYDRCGMRARLTPIQVTWHGMAIAEARDLNRHRTGERHFETTHVGLYIPREVREGIEASSFSTFTNAHREILQIGKDYPFGGVKGAGLPYALVLGSQGTFFRTTTLAKFAYEVELRTGPGAHFRYAEHYRAAMEDLEGMISKEDLDAIPVGEAEPE